MAEYIEREALLLRIDCHGTNKFGMLDEDIRAFVKAQPAVDAAPVVHGLWMPVYESEMTGWNPAVAGRGRRRSNGYTRSRRQSIPRVSQGQHQRPG